MDIDIKFGWVFIRPNPTPFDGFVVIKDDGTREEIPPAYKHPFLKEGIKE